MVKAHLFPPPRSGESTSSFEIQRQDSGPPPSDERATPGYSLVEVLLQSTYYYYYYYYYCCCKIMHCYKLHNVACRLFQNTRNDVQKQWSECHSAILFLLVEVSGSVIINLCISAYQRSPSSSSGSFYLEPWFAISLEDLKDESTTIQTVIELTFDIESETRRI
ncbi:hypothetical protein BJX65DRAFT_171956 [Aspergillus insuetus]